jgi:uncharacterized protein
MMLLAGVFTASLLGSVHCGAMCGAFACLANRASRRDVWYHGGRLLAYLALGLLAGGAGATLNAAGMVARIQHTAAIITGLMLIGWGAVQLRNASRPGAHAAVSAWGGVLQRIMTRTAAWPPAARATAIGLTTGLLPCGWLWAFLATAVGAGSPLRAALVMLVFWAGTVPALVAVTVGATRLRLLSRVRWPAASAVLVLVLGIGQLAAHVLLPLQHSAAGQAHVHGGDR